MVFQLPSLLLHICIHHNMMNNELDWNWCKYTNLLIDVTIGVTIRRCVPYLILDKPWWVHFTHLHEDHQQYNESVTQMVILFWKTFIRTATESVAMMMQPQLGGVNSNHRNPYLIASSSILVLLVYIMCKPDVSASFTSSW